MSLSEAHIPISYRNFELLFGSGFKAGSNSNFTQNGGCVVGGGLLPHWLPHPVLSTGASGMRVRTDLSGTGSRCSNWLLAAGELDSRAVPRVRIDPPHSLHPQGCPPAPEPQSGRPTGHGREGTGVSASGSLRTSEIILFGCKMGDDLGSPANTESNVELPPSSQ